MKSVPPSRPFLWGVATSAYQIEGGATENGRAPSVWDDFCRRPGAVHDGHSGGIACDHWHRWEEDLDLMAALGIRAYRFSVSWPRVMPEVGGEPCSAGLDFYERLVDGLLDRDIQPMLTLYHWDLPLAIEERGGWLARDTAEAFSEYSAALARRLGDRVGLWGTINEIPVLLLHAYGDGLHAPGLRLSLRDRRQVQHHLLLAHGLAIKALRAECSRRVRVGLIDAPAAPAPFTDDETDVTAAREEFLRLNAWRHGPLYRGGYPEDQWQRAGREVPELADGDIEIIAEPQDFLGLNVYSSWTVAQAGRQPAEPESHFPRTQMGWPIMPDCLRWAARFAHETCAPEAIHITECGCAWDDQVNDRGEVDDFARIEFMRSHLRGVEQALEEGIPIQGFFLWSLLDNFEWAHGFSRRFGIVHVNFETLKRTPKASAHWYARHIAANTTARPEMALANQ